VNDEPTPAQPEAKLSMTSEIWTAGAIVLVAIAMIVQAVFFTGDRLSTTTEAINRLW
jgi:hypothetical protein